MTSQINWDSVRDTITAAMDGRSMRAFGADAGIDHGTLSKFLSGKTVGLTVELLERVAAEIGMPVPQLMYGPGAAVPAADPTPAPANAVRDIPLVDIAEWPGNPRKHFDQDELDSLAESIGARGVLQPIVVRGYKTAIGERFEIVAGARRFRAAGIAGLATIPAIIRDVDDRDMLVDAVIENLQRTNPSVMEEARAFAALTQIHGLSAGEIARQTGQSPRQVQQRIALVTRLCDAAQDAIDQGKLRPSYARALAQAPQGLQPDLLSRIIATLPGWDSEAAIQASISALLPPESAALFAVEEYERAGGEMVELSPGMRRFADPDLFTACQEVAIRERVEELRDSGTVVLADERDGKTPRWKIAELITRLGSTGAPDPHGAGVYVLHLRADSYLTATEHGPFREPTDTELRRQINLPAITMLTRVRGIIAASIASPLSLIKPDSDLGEDLGVDPQGIGNIFDALTFELDIEFSDRDIERLTTPAKIAAWLDEDGTAESGEEDYSTPAAAPVSPHPEEGEARLEGRGATRDDGADLFGTPLPPHSEGKGGFVGALTQFIEDKKRGFTTLPEEGTARLEGRGEPNTGAPAPLPSPSDARARIADASTCSRFASERFDRAVALLTQRADLCEVNPHGVLIGPIRLRAAIGFAMEKLEAANKALSAAISHWPSEPDYIAAQNSDTPAPVIPGEPASGETRDLAADTPATEETAP